MRITAGALAGALTVLAAAPPAALAAGDNVPTSVVQAIAPKDASTIVMPPREFRLADLTVLKLDDRSIHVRFTLGGEVAPPAAPAHGPRGQALISLHLSVAVTPMP